MMRMNKKCRTSTVESQIGLEVALFCNVNKNLAICHYFIPAYIEKSNHYNRNVTIIMEQ